MAVMMFAPKRSGVCAPLSAQILELAVVPDWPLEPPAERETIGLQDGRVAFVDFSPSRLHIEIFPKESDVISKQSTKLLIQSTALAAAKLTDEGSTGTTLSLSISCPVSQALEDLIPWRDLPPQRRLQHGDPLALRLMLRGDGEELRTRLSAVSDWWKGVVSQNGVAREAQQQEQPARADDAPGAAAHPA